jgi:hypothetical protein
VSGQLNIQAREPILVVSAASFYAVYAVIVLAPGGFDRCWAFTYFDACSGMSPFGTKRPFVDVRYSVAIEGKADLPPAVVNRRE